VVCGNGIAVDTIDGELLQHVGNKGVHGAV
jgi:hypothetical protein